MASAPGAGAAAGSVSPAPAASASALPGSVQPTSAPLAARLATRSGLRLLAIVLVMLWGATAVAVAVAYRPGGPIDLIVILACSLPVFVAAAGVAWPPLAVEHRERVFVVWLWIAAFLLAIPILYGVAYTLATGGPQNLVPSAEAAWAGIVALFSMSLFSLAGVVHARHGVPLFERRATRWTLVSAALATVAVGSAFGAVAFINDQAVRPDVPRASSFGPVDPELVPPLCDEPMRLGPSARIRVTASSQEDEVERGQAVLEGRRAGVDEAWTGSWSGIDGEGAVAYLRVGPRAWVNTQSDSLDSPGTTWQRVAPDPFGLAGSGLTMDGPPFAIATVPRGTIVVEDIGLELIDGARARHCRTFIDGPTALAAFLPLRWLLTDDVAAGTDALHRWRGELDWWVFADGQMGRASAEVSGASGDADWARDGVTGTLRAELDAVDRHRRVEVTVPTSGIPGSGSSGDSGIGAPDVSGVSGAPDVSGLPDTEPPAP